MFKKGFRHIDPDAFHGHELTLHDCTTDKISYENNLIRFSLPDGLWVTPHHKENDTGKVLRTDAAVVTFVAEDLDDIVIRVLTRGSRLFRSKTRVEIWDMKQLINAVNCGKCTLEFITQYRTCFEQLWFCDIRSKKKPYYRECQIHLPNTKAEFCWNNLCLDREW